MMAPRQLPETFQPPALTAAMVAALNAAAAHGPARFKVGADALTVSVRPVTAPAPGALRLDLKVGGEAASLVVPPGLLSAAGLPGAGPDAELAALQLEAALADMLSDMEVLLGIDIVFDALRVWQSGALGAADALGLQVSHGTQAFACVLHAGPFALATLAAAAACPHRAVLDASQPILACFRAGVSDVLYAELMSLRPGDAVLMEDCGLRDGRVLVVFGECWAASGHGRDGAVRLDARPGPAGATFFRGWCMADGSYDLAAQGHSHDPADADVTELRVTLVFEFGRRTASLAEVAALGPGSVLETGGGPDRSVDVLANGRRIGRGTVVLVGGAFAVQLHSIHVPGQPVAASQLRHPAPAPVAADTGHAQATMPVTDGTV